MKTRIAPIGDSPGPRISKPLLQQTGLARKVDIPVKKDSLVNRPLSRTRAGWDEAFQQMADRGDDAPVLGETVTSEWDDREWRW